MVRSRSFTRLCSRWCHAHFRLYTPKALCKPLQAQLITLGTLKCTYVMCVLSFVRPHVSALTCVLFCVLLLCVCSHRCALMCLFIHACFHMRGLLFHVCALFWCALKRVFSCLCSHVCALICVLTCVCSHMCAFMRLLSFMCMLSMLL